MPSQRLILGIGFAILLAISGASIALDVKSRADAARVDHTLEVLNRISDVRLLFRQAESGSRGYLLTNDPNLLKNYHQAFEQIAPALAELKEALRDNTAQAQLLANSEPLVASRFAVNSDLVRLQAAGDSAGIAVVIGRAKGRALMESIEVNFEQLAKEERRLLAIRSADSRRTGSILLAIDLSGAALILMLSTILIRESLRSSRKREAVLQATEAANETLEAAVAERTRHMLEANEELRHSTSVLNSTFASMAEAVVVIDNKGAILLSNLAAGRMFNDLAEATIDKLMEKTVEYQTDGTTRLAPGDRSMVRALRGEQFDGHELILRHADKTEAIHIVASGCPLHDGAGAIYGAAVVYHDITAARETERKLHQSQKLDAIGKLTGGVAHDFNNMLTVITGATETLVAGLQGQPPLLDVASLIDQAAERCGELIQHLLAFARKQPLQPRNVDINDTILDITKLLRPTLGEQIEIESILEQEVATAHIDPSQLANALLNLAINARDAMPNGGKLLLETKNVVLDETYVQSNTDVRSGPYVMIAVSDTGTGMAADVFDKVFEPFFTTKEVGKGNGLGLSMVYGFVKQSGGHIKIYSEEGHGTTIRLYLPPASGRVDASSSPAAPLSGGTETILVVEDDALVLNFVIVQLNSLGYKTIVAANGRAALAHVESGQPFDLLFTDVIMPGGMTGRQLAEEVVKRRPGTRVLYTSGYTDNAIVHHGRLDQGVLLLTKPYRKSGLAGMVRLALEGAPASV
jgi:signal transduction histidine kinase/CHASE3 domain sensor protein